MQQFSSFYFLFSSIASAYKKFILTKPNNSLQELLSPPQLWDCFLSFILEYQMITWERYENLISVISNSTSYENLLLEL